MAYALVMAGYAQKPYEQSPLIVFLDGHFHEDWRIDADNWQSVVDEFLESADDRAIAEVIADIDEAFAERRDPAVTRLLAVHLVNLDFEHAGFGTAWGWLTIVRQMLTRRLEGVRQDGPATPGWPA